MLDVIIKCYLNIKCWTRYLLAVIWYCDFCLYFKRKVVFNTRFFSLGIKNVETKFILCSKTLLSFSTFLYDSHFSASQCWSLETFLPPWIFLLLMLDVMRKKIWISFFFNFKIILFSFGCAGSSLLLGLFFPSCGQGLLSVVVFPLRWLLLLLSTDSRACGLTGSIVVARRLSCSSACGIFSDQGSNLGLLYWWGGFFTTEAPGKPLH